MVLLPCAPVRAEDGPTATLTITASRDARRTVTLARPLTLWLEDPEHGPAYSSGARYAGFVLVPEKRGAPGAGVARLPGAGGAPIGVLAGDDPVPTLPAGRYTLAVVADEPVTIRVRASGTRSTTWRAAAPLPVARVDASMSSVVRQAHGDAFLDLTAASAVFTVTTFRVTGTTVPLTWCVFPDGDGCSSARAAVRHYTSGGAWVHREIAVAFALAPRTLGEGRWRATWSMETDGVLHDVAAYALVVG
jgi:hypothetical protein